MTIHVPDGNDNKTDIIHDNKDDDADDDDDDDDDDESLFGQHVGILSQSSSTRSCVPVESLRSNPTMSIVNDTEWKAVTPSSVLETIELPTTLTGMTESTSKAPPTQAHFNVKDMPCDGNHHNSAPSPNNTKKKKKGQTLVVRAAQIQESCGQPLMIDVDEARGTYVVAAHSIVYIRYKTPHALRFTIHSPRL
jgi:hypothetical protein